MLARKARPARQQLRKTTLKSDHQPPSPGYKYPHSPTSLLLLFFPPQHSSQCSYPFVFPHLIAQSAFNSVCLNSAPDAARLAYRILILLHSSQPASVSLVNLFQKYIPSIFFSCFSRLKCDLSTPRKYVTQAVLFPSP